MSSLWKITKLFHRKYIIFDTLFNILLNNYFYLCNIIGINIKNIKYFI